MVVLCLQWNSYGYFKRLPELQQLISKYQPLVICLQETHLRPQNKINLPNYTSFRHDHIQTNHASDGVAILVHNSISAQQLFTNTPLQTVSISAKILSISKNPITITSIYIPPKLNIATQDLLSLTSQLPSPLIICGDFNAHSPTWGGIRNNNRGNAVDALLLSDPDLILLNSHGTPTHFSLANKSFSSTSPSAPLH